MCCGLAASAGFWSSRAPELLHSAWGIRFGGLAYHFDGDQLYSPDMSFPMVTSSAAMLVCMAENRAGNAPSFSSSRGAFVSKVERIRIGRGGAAQEGRVRRPHLVRSRERLMTTTSVHVRSNQRHCIVARSHGNGTGHDRPTPIQDNGFSQKLDSPRDRGYIARRGTEFTMAGDDRMRSRPCASWVILGHNNAGLNMSNECTRVPPGRRLTLR